MTAWTTLEVDGVAYKARKADAMTVVHLSCWATRTFGGALANTIATSDNLMGIVESAITEAASMAKDAATKSEADVRSELGDRLKAELLGMVKSKAREFVTMLGDATMLMAEHLTPPEVEQAIDMLAAGRLMVPAADNGQPILIDDLRAFNDFVTPYVHELGPLHVFRLLWALVNFQVGPMHGGEPGQTRSPTTEPAAA